MGKRLFLGNLPHSTTEDSLKEAFSQFGIVESVKIITDKVTCQSKGFGFLEMATIQGAVSAIAKMHGSVMGGRELKVSEAKPLVPREGPDMKRGHVDSGFRG
jgi:RNA recognition motif-containing protein